MVHVHCRLLKIIHRSFFASYNTRLFCIVWPAWSVPGDLSAQNKVNPGQTSCTVERIFCALNQVILEIPVHNFIGTTSYAIKHEVNFSSVSRYSVGIGMLIFFLGKERGPYIPHHVSNSLVFQYLPTYVKHTPVSVLMCFRITACTCLQSIYNRRVEFIVLFLHCERRLYSFLLANLWKIGWTSTFNQMG